MNHDLATQRFMAALRVSDIWRRADERIAGKGLATPRLYSPAIAYIAAMEEAFYAEGLHTHTSYPDGLVFMRIIRPTALAGLSYGMRWSMSMRVLGDMDAATVLGITQEILDRAECCEQSEMTEEAR